jgi:hypothetical protein
LLRGVAGLVAGDTRKGGIEVCVYPVCGDLFVSVRVIGVERGRASLRMARPLGGWSGGDVHRASVAVAIRAGGVLCSASGRSLLLRSLKGREGLLSRTQVAGLKRLGQGAERGGRAALCAAEGLQKRGEGLLRRAQVARLQRLAELSEVVVASRGNGLLRALIETGVRT